jgi:hypothetical protein
MSIAFERGRVAAETLAGLAWPFVEDVSEAATADRPRDLDTVHSSVVPHPAHRYEPVTLLEYVAPGEWPLGAFAAQHVLLGRG